MRYYHCGEYGEKLGRPHYHALIFGHDFPDKYVWQIRGNQIYYRSPSLEKIWKRGMIIIGEVTFESAAYVARYMMKKLKGSNTLEHLDHYGGRQEEYATMSRGRGEDRGIGYKWFKKYYKDVYPKDFITIRSGVKCRPPTYYDKLYALTHPKQFDKIQIERRRRACAPNPDNTSARLKVREFIHLARSEKLIRGYENDIQCICNL